MLTKYTPCGIQMEKVKYSFCSFLNVSLFKYKPSTLPQRLIIDELFCSSWHRSLDDDPRVCPGQRHSYYGHRDYQNVSLWSFLLQWQVRLWLWYWHFNFLYFIIPFYLCHIFFYSAPYIFSLVTHWPLIYDTCWIVL